MKVHGVVWTPPPASSDCPHPSHPPSAGAPFSVHHGVCLAPVCTMAVWCRLAPSVSWDGHTLPWADQLVIQGPIPLTVQGPHVRTHVLLLCVDFQETNGKYWMRYHTICQFLI